MVLNNRQLNRALLARQQLLKRKRRSVAKTIHAVGGLQPQEPRDAFISLWSRIDGFDPDRLRAASAKREVVRGTAMRCTIHTLSRADYLNFRRSFQTMIDRAYRPLSDLPDGLPADRVIEAANALLADQEPRSARRLGEQLSEQFPGADATALARFTRMSLALAMIPGDERWSYSRPPRYLQAENWLDAELRSDTPLADLVVRGLAAIGPASSADLRTWSGMPGIREALEQLRPQLITFRDQAGRELFDLPGAPRPRADTPAPSRFLGEYDNVFLSHTDRARIVSMEDAKKFALTKNGRRLFAFTVDGFVAGIWKWERKRERASLTVSPFRKVTARTRDELEAEAAALLRMLEPDAAEYDVQL